MSRLDDFAARHGWSIVVFCISIVAGATVLRGQVLGKADRVDVERMRIDISAQIEQVKQRQDALLYLLCRDSHNANDSVCKR